MKKKQLIYPVVDFGNYYIRVMIAEFIPNHAKLRVLGYGLKENTAMKHGIVTDLSTAKECLKIAYEEAERTSGYQIHEADVSISAPHISSLNSYEENPIINKVTRADAINTIYRANKYGQNEQFELIHAIEQQFGIDNNYGIENPVGMEGKSLKVYMHLVNARRIHLQQINDIMAQVGIRTHAMVFSGLAASYMSTTREERSKGVLAIDIGYATTNFVIWSNGYPVYSDGFALGGNSITEEFAENLKVDKTFAETLKLEGCALSTELTKRSTFVTPEYIGKTFTSEQICHYLSSSYNRILGTCLERTGKFLRESKIKIQTIVITGGAASIPGLDIYARKRLQDLEIRIPELPEVNNLSQDLTNRGLFTILGMIKLWHNPLSEQVWIKPIGNNLINKIINKFTY